MGLFRNLSANAKYSTGVHSAGLLLRTCFVSHARKTRNAQPHFDLKTRVEFAPFLADADPGEFDQEDLEILYCFALPARGANGPYCSRGESEKNQK